MFLLWHFLFLCMKFLPSYITLFLCLCGRSAVPLGLQWCNVPSGLLRSHSSRLSDAGLQFGSFNCKQGSNSMVYLVCTAQCLSCSVINKCCELWSECTQCRRRVNLFAGFVVSRVSRLEQTTVTATQANYPLCLSYYRGQGLWVLSFSLYRYAVRNDTQT